MFGLTAASYAFIWGELKSEEETNSKIRRILEKYKSELWDLFFNALIFSFAIVIMNLILLGLIQNITKNTLSYSIYNIWKDKDVTVNTYYYNDQYDVITKVVLINLFFSILDVFLMGALNYKVFHRNRSYEKIACGMLKRLNSTYNLQLPEKIQNKHEQISRTAYSYCVEFNKIHYIELMMIRIFKNHESEGDAYNRIHKEEELLKQIIGSKLNKCNHTWEYISNSQKRYDIINKISCKISEEIKTTKCCSGNQKKIDPICVNFTETYDDLILYRDAKLFLNSIDSKKLSKNGNVDGTMLKCTIKKRLLLLLLSNERFDGMDLANMSLSGADLSYSNFSNCNLKGVRLKGTNCKGVDFSGSRMPGIHFRNVLGSKRKPNNANEDDVEITYDDDGKSEWNIYAGRQPTCLEMATFANADVSRMTLIAEGCIEENKFPFPENMAVPVFKNKDSFRLCDTNFDGAKLFNSIFNNINLSRSSIFKAQMFNSELILVNAEKVNFGETVLTHSILECSRFVNASFQKAVMSDCDVYRCDFSWANFSNANFSNSKITLCNFKNSICNNTSFKNINFNKEKIDCDDYTVMSFEYATLRDADFSNAILHKSSFSHANVLNCNFTKSKISGTKFDLTVLASTIWNSTEASKMEFKETVMRDCVFINVKFTYCKFYGCDFSGSIVNSTFFGGEMINVKFCNVKGMNPRLFENVTLSHVDFTGSGIRRSDFSETVDLKNCIFDKRARRGSSL